MKCNTCNATEATPLLACPSTAQCATPFKAQNLNWGRAEACAIYADKIFSAHTADGSSIFYQLDTANDTDGYLSVYELTPCSGGCCCSASTLSTDAVFEIQKSYLQIDCFSVNETAATATTLSPESVTVNGYSVSSVTVNNGTYTADLSSILPSLTNSVCAAQGLPSKAYLLLQNVSNLELRARFGFEGVVRSAGVLYRFKAYLANNTALQLPTTVSTSFAVAEMSIPCTENGMAPTVRFRFGACADLINPTLSVAEAADESGDVRVNLACTLGIVPKAYVEVIRNTLLNVTAAEQAADTTCGMDGFSLYAGTNCCNAAAGTARTATAATVNGTCCTSRSGIN